MISLSAKFIAANEAFLESRRVAFQELSSTMMQVTKQMPSIFSGLPIYASSSATTKSRNAFKMSSELLSSFNELAALGTETLPQEFSQGQGAVSRSQTLFPEAAKLDTLDVSKDLTYSHFDAVAALSTTQTQVNVNASFDIVRHAYARLVGFKIIPKSLIASAKFERALSAQQDCALETVGWLSHPFTRQRQEIFRWLRYK